MSNSEIMQLHGVRPQANPRLRVEALTSLRFFAAMAIIFRHFSNLGDGVPQLFRQEADHGFTAVSFFFVLSGFVLTYSYSGRDGRMKGTRSAFYWARFARIYPAYLFAAVAAIPLLFMTLRQVHTLAGTLMRIAACGTLVVALVQSWLPWTANYLNSPAWSLSVEAFFYLLFPLALPLVTGLSKPRIVSLLVLSWILLVLPPIAIWALKGNSVDNTIWGAWIQAFPIFRLPEFLMGSLTARLFLLSAPSRRMGSVMAWLSGGVILAVLGSSFDVPELVLGNGLFAPLFCLLIWFASSAEGSFKAVFASPILIFLGEISYSIYILQEPVSNWFAYLSGHATRSAFGYYVVVLLLASAGCFWFVERPLGRAIRGFANRQCVENRPLKEVPVLA